MRIKRVPATLGFPALALLVAATASLSPAANATERHAATPAAAMSSSAVPEFDHVVVVLFENTNYETIKGSSKAPYFNSLAAQGTLFTNSFGITHPSQPNYIGLFSGSQHGVTGDDCTDLSGDNLGQQLAAVGKTFKAYSEGLPSAGSRTCKSGKYRRKHAPWASFAGTAGSSTHVPFSSFPSDYAKLPDVSFVVPDMCNDMHDCSTGTGDTWLKRNLDGYVQWAKTHNSLLITTFDEDDFRSVNQIHTVFVGQNVKAGYQSPTQINHYSVLRTLEDMHGLPPLGEATRKTAVTDAWSATAGPVITAPGNQGATAGTATTLQLSASGGTAPYTWAATGLPAGLSLDPTLGRVSGTPTTPGTASVTVTAKDAAGAVATTSFTWTVRPAGSGSVLFDDDFEADRGWTVNASGTDTATSGAWERGDPDETRSTYGPKQVKQLGTTVSGTNALSTGARAGAEYGANDLDGGASSVRSPAITLPAGATAPNLRFSYNLATGDNSGADDHFRVRVLDGTQATTVFERNGTATEVAGTWQVANVDLSAFAGRTVRVEIEAADAGTASLIEAQVDDVTITG
ncbi:hypothetical protein B4N89_41745 [Embleya scabrispora]|uniref:MAM domain-containing protein n=2 Tax=Embleya scabrispora TaxID=159449 RepID=A0A1T3NJZ6_9ACTN|nr:hypothetical protein B4N89_41745 [Embleya scabrispora]